MRSLDDFMLSKARFDSPRLSGRIVSNLHYYQTNYFAIVVIIFVLFGLANPQKMLLSLVIISVTIVSIGYTNKYLKHMTISSGGGSVGAGGNPQNRTPTTAPPMIMANQNQTYLSITTILAVGYLTLHNMSSILMLLSCLAVSLALILLHASTRLRNLKNKFNEKLVTKLVDTPMGLLLTAINIKLDDKLLN
ncbi:PRA1 family protein 2-like [Oppia nitens]|uniref:PRA1 family protein 2-like n=1 Tax=Oppia nitens TaxID=1686743 RepID=UPI0023DCB234|nr:PRA1 family protein 2-like [Oppia nitens]